MTTTAHEKAVEAGIVAACSTYTHYSFQQAIEAAITAYNASIAEQAGDVVETLAHAMCDEEYVPAGPGGWNQRNKPEKDAWRETARDLLASLRERGFTLTKDKSND